MLWKNVVRGRQNSSNTLSSSTTHFDHLKPIEKLHFQEVPTGSELKFQQQYWLLFLTSVSVFLAKKRFWSGVFFWLVIYKFIHLSACTVRADLG